MVLTQEERIEALCLFNNGKKVKEIADLLKCHRSSIYHLINKKKNTGSVKNLKKSGRPRITSKKDDKLLKRMSIKNRRFGSRQLATEFNSSMAQSVLSPRTVRRRLLEEGLKSCRAKRKPLLSLKARKKRLEWAKKHLEFDWNNVVFSDESRFTLKSDRPILVRRRTGEAFKSECLASTVKHGGGGIMVWGCFSIKGVGKLHKIQGTINSDHYIKILKYCAVPSMQHLYPGGGDCFFQQDNATCHTSKKVTQWFSENDIRVIPWPGNSPDMNPIEHIWDYIDRKICNQQFKNLDELYNEVQKIWFNIPHDFIKSLIDSMTRRLDALIAARGGPTKY